MNTKQLLSMVEERGLKVILKEGQPYLQRNETKNAVTDALLAVLKVHRDKIIALLGGKDSNDP